MIIDEILDRKDGRVYDPAEFAAYVHETLDIFPGVAEPIEKALASDCEQAVKHALCGYVLTQGYNPEICDFINSCAWLPAWWDRS